MPFPRRAVPAIRADWRPPAKKSKQNWAGTRSTQTSIPSFCTPTNGARRIRTATACDRTFLCPLTLQPCARKFLAFGGGKVGSADNDRGKIGITRCYVGKESDIQPR